MKNIELLAPAGNMNSLKAAISAGCNAVYLAGKLFGARSFAGNFTNEEIIEAINYSHLYGVKVYITVNTLIYDDEVESFLEYIDFIHRNNVDAVIIQDLGMLDLVRKTYPNLEIHASTQMHIHNDEGVKFAKSIGIKRVVLARETDINTIREIKKNNDIELEIFVHGALCISYSGQCLMSALIGGRSGNRGSCAQCCRQKYDLIVDNKKINSNNYLLSTKDLNTLEHINELLDIGVDSIKIEGRMKRPEYVYLVVSLYRKAIDSYLNNDKVNISNDDIKELKKIFNRDFTKGFLFNEENNKITNDYRPNHMGIQIGKVIDYHKGIVTIKLNNTLNINDGIRIISKNSDTGITVTEMFVNKIKVKRASTNNIVTFKLKDKVNINDIVLKTTDYLQLKDINDKINNKERKISVKMGLTINSNNTLKLSLNDGINEVVVKSNEKVENAISNPTTHERIYDQLSKLGNTIYKLESLDIKLSNNLFVNISSLNNLRREAVNELNKKRMYKILYQKKEYKINVPDFLHEKNLNILISDIRMYNQIKSKNYHEIFVDNINTYEKIKSDSRVILKIPRVINNYQNYNETLLVGEIGSINKYNSIYTDFSFNVTNAYTVAFLHSLGVKKITLSYELEDTQIKTLMENYYKLFNQHPNLELIISARPEVMISKFNLLDKYKINRNIAYLKDRFNNLYKIIIKDNLMYIYNFQKIEYQNKDKYYSLGINNLRINLDDEIK